MLYAYVCANKESRKRYCAVTWMAIVWLQEYMKGTVYKHK